MSRKNSNALAAPKRKSRPAQGPRRVAEGEHFAFAHQTNKALGQHFLRDESVIARIALEAQGSLPLGAPRQAVEIGPGSGALTKALLADGWILVALEKDPRAAEGLRTHLVPQFPDALSVVETDVLRWSPEAADAANEGSARANQRVAGADAVGNKAAADAVSENESGHKDAANEGSARVRPAKELCCGNLPYYITSDILFWFLTHAKHFSAGLFMIQDEVADRLNARPGTKDYGRLTVRLQLSCTVEKVLFVPANAFVPPPKVNSAVVRLVPREEPPFANAAEEKSFGTFTALLFSARRKMLRRALASDLDSLAHKGGEAAVAALWKKAGDFGIREDTRPDAIAPEGILALFRLLRGGANSI
jgi:16S rRNA (adenine1518-N6/adenine1519-N6)-dimethyltransferase